MGQPIWCEGAGVPALGLVNELTSAVDIYQVMAKLHGFEAPEYTDGNLPAVFGGEERKYTIREILSKYCLHQMAQLSTSRDFTSQDVSTA